MKSDNDDECWFFINKQSFFYKKTSLINENERETPRLLPLTMGGFLSSGSVSLLLFFERIRFQDLFYFFVEKTLLLMKNQHFIIIITFHQITHQLVLSIFTWDFIFSSKFSLWKHHSQKNFPHAAGSSRSLRSQSPVRYVSWPKICLRWRKSDPPLYEHPRTAPLGSAVRGPCMRCAVIWPRL